MDSQEQQSNYNPPKHNGRIWGGLFLLAVGAVFLLKEMDYPFFPDWLFTWPMILIAIGIFSGLKHGFRGPGWLIMLTIGGFFLVDEMNIGFDIHRFLVPTIIIAVGLMLILRPHRNRDSGWGNWDRRRRAWRDWRDWRRENWNQPFTPNYPPTQPTPAAPVTGTAPGTDQASGSKEDFIDTISVFGSVRRIVVSKNFKGGDITCFFGGAEIDLTQADITGTVLLDVTAVLGGAKLIIPPHWDIKSEVSAVLGSIDDKRQVQGNLIDPNKVLLIKGTAFMGGIEIKSY